MPRLPSDLKGLVRDIAACIKRIDERHPQATNARSGAPYQPGFGPHPESQAVALIAEELAHSATTDAARISVGVAYPGSRRQMCDLCLGTPPGWDWVIEVKMLRLMGDNGKPNDNMLMHILSPYPIHRSALTDCRKLVDSGFMGRKALLIYGFDYAELPMDPAIEAFELLAGKQVLLGARAESAYDRLVHPIHQRGRVFGWEISARSNA
jgi:hypothetical protein